MDADERAKADADIAAAGRIVEAPPQFLPFVAHKPGDPPPRKVPPSWWNEDTAWAEAQAVASWASGYQQGG